MKSFKLPSSPLEQAIQAIPIFTSAKQLNLELPLDEDGCCLSPFRDESKPSFSIYANGTRWHDHATGEGGDVVDFIAKALDPERSESDLDKSRAAKMLIQWHRERSYLEVPTARQFKKTPKAKSLTSKHFKKPDWRKPEVLELNQIKNDRGLAGFSGMLELQRRGMLKFTDWGPDSVWALTDNSGHNAQVRPVYPHQARWEVKARTLPGGGGSWPIGLPFVSPCSKVLICEGPPDLLAVATVVCREHPEDLSDTAFLAITGTPRIPKELIPHFSGKRIRYFAHHDTAGIGAAKRIQDALSPVASNFDFWISDMEGEDFNDYASRRWRQGCLIEETKMA
jgi:hypothetical protein